MAEEIAGGGGDRIQKVFDELQAHETLIAGCISSWRSLADHFAGLEKEVEARASLLDSKRQELDSDTKESLAAIDSRETSFPSRESAAAAGVVERRDAALAEIEAPDPADPPTDVSGLLRWYCRRMDSSGLWKFVMSRRKEPMALRSEIPDAVALAVDPARLLLDIVDEFVEDHPSIAGDPQQGAGSDGCRMLGILLRVLYHSPDGEQRLEVAGKIRDRAAVIAEQWREKTEGEGGKFGGQEAQMLLQMVVSFGLQSNFDRELMRKLVVENASRREIPKIAAGLGFGSAMEGIVDELAKNGKGIEAAYFAFEFGLGDQFSPAPLLKSHLQNVRKNASSLIQNGNRSMSAKEESITYELNASKAIMKCVEVCNLESSLSTEGMKKRVESLQKAKVNQKKTSAPNKPRMKRPRSDGAAPHLRSGEGGRVAISATYPTPFHRNTLAAHHVGASRHTYNFPAQSTYNNAAPPPYGASASFGAAAAYSRSPSGSVAQQYYASEELGGGISGTTAYGGAPAATYGSYDYTAASHTASAAQMQPPYPR